MKYFLHDTNALDDEKVSELYMQFGYEGVGLFYCALEKFAKQEKPIKTAVIKRQLSVKKRLEKCWQFMEEIGLIYSENNESFNIKLLNFSETFKKNREKTAKRVSEYRERQQVTENVTSYKRVSNATNSKVSNSIINNTSFLQGTQDAPPAEKNDDSVVESKASQRKRTLPKREEEFKKSLNAYAQTKKNPHGYPPEMLIKFAAFWVEPNKSGTSMKWELEKTWSLSGRLAYWASNGKEKRKVNGTPLQVVDESENKEFFKV